MTCVKKILALNMLARMHAIIYADIDGSIFYVSFSIGFLSLKAQGCFIHKLYAFIDYGYIHTANLSL